MKTKKIKKLKTRLYHRLEQSNPNLTRHLSIQDAIDEAVDLRDVHDNLLALVHDAVESLAIVKREMA